MKKYIVVDIGGTMLKYGLISEDGILEENHEIPTEADKGGPHIVKVLKELVKQLKAKHEISGVAISTAGMVDPDSGRIIYANEFIPDYTGTPLKQLIETEFCIPCEVENDVSCAGLAEHLTGAAKGSRSSVCLTIGTGIGGCIILDNKIYHGCSNSAGEIGYMNILGRVFQKAASTSSLVERVAHHNPELTNWNGKLVFERARTGDKICEKSIEEMCEILGCGIANICYVINPEVIVIGGGIANDSDYLYEKIRKSMDKYLIHPISDHTKLHFATNGNKAGMIGAYYNFKNRQEERRHERI